MSEAQSKNKRAVTKTLSKQSEVDEDEAIAVSDPHPRLKRTAALEDEANNASGTSASGSQESLDDDKKDMPNQRLRVLTRVDAVQQDDSTLVESSQSQSSTEEIHLPLPVKGLTTGSQNSLGSLETPSPSLSRDGSTENAYTDSTGIDLEEFIIVTINKNARDRKMLLELEQELTRFIQENKEPCIKFGPYSPYNRMLVHRVSAFFGLDHNIDQTGKSIVITRTVSTRIPELNFSEQIDPLLGTQDTTESLGKAVVVKKIEQRGSKAHGISGDKRSKSLDGKKSRSIEEREREYDVVKNRIFKKELTGDMHLHSPGDALGRPWCSTDSSYGSIECERQVAPFIKSHSYSGPGPGPGPGKPASNTQNTPELSKPNLTQSAASTVNQVVSKLPDGQSVVWVATPIERLAPGSIIMNPLTGKPLANADGSIYQYQLPAGDSGEKERRVNTNTPPMAKQSSTEIVTSTQQHKDPATTLISQNVKSQAMYPVYPVQYVYSTDQPMNQQQKSHNNHMLQFTGQKEDRTGVRGCTQQFIESPESYSHQPGNNVHQIGSPAPQPPVYNPEQRVQYLTIPTNYNCAPAVPAPIQGYVAYNTPAPEVVNTGTMANNVRKMPAGQYNYPPYMAAMGTQQRMVATQHLQTVPVVPVQVPINAPSRYVNTDVVTNPGLQSDSALNQDQ